MIAPFKLMATTDHNWTTRRGKCVMNSTSHHFDDTSPTLPCELSSINATAEAPLGKAAGILKNTPDTPAKIFARMKAKVQKRQSFAEVASDHAKNQNLCHRAAFSPRKRNFSHKTYVLDLSPPKSQTDVHHGEPEIFPEENQIMNGRLLNSYVLLEKMSEQLNTEQTHLPDKNCYRNKKLSMLERVIPEKPSQFPKHRNFLGGLNDVRSKGSCVVFEDRSLLADIGDQNDELTVTETGIFKSPETQPPVKSESDFESRALAPGRPLLPQSNLLQDSILQLSPRVLIPRKQSKTQSRPRDTQKPVAADGNTNVDIIHLRNWVLKLLNSELIVDGIRVDNQIPWHSSFIEERISSNVIKTRTGKTYVLVGKMGKCQNSPFPSWFLKNFFFGFPKMWKEFLDQFLNGSQKKLKDDKPIKASKSRIPQALKIPPYTHSRNAGNNQSPVTPTDSVQPDSVKVSRSGRLIKPPLEYWKGGRVVMDSQMNMTIHEDYSTLVTPSTKYSCTVAQVAKSSGRGKRITLSSEDELFVPVRKVREHSLNRVRLQKNLSPEESSSRTKTTRYHNGSALGTSPGHSEKKKVGSPQRASLRKQQSGSRKEALKSEMTVQALSDQCCEEKQPVKKTTRISKSSQKRPQDEQQPSLSHNSPNYFIQSSASATVSQCSLASLDLPKRPGKKCSTERKQLPKPPEDSVRRSLRTRKTPDHFVDDSSGFSPEDIAQTKQLKKTKTQSTKQKKRSRKGERKNDVQAESRKESDFKEQDHDLQDNRGAKKSKLGKPRKEEFTNVNKPGETLDTWTEEERHELHAAVKSLPKHMSNYWANVASLVRNRSAEECQEHYAAESQRTRNKRPKKQTQKKAAAAKEAEKGIVSISAKAGTLKRRHQMREFLDHMPKDDHDDMFAASPQQSKLIRLPAFTANEEEDFSQLQNPQTPSCCVPSSAKTPQCLHISPGMLGSIDKNTMDKYIFQFQKNKKGRQRGKKSTPMDKLTSSPAVKKTLKRCVAEDEDFVVWNMLSDKEIPSRTDDSEEEDDYFMEYC